MKQLNKNNKYPRFLASGIFICNNVKRHPKVSLFKLVLYQVLLGSKIVALNSMSAKKLSLINLVQQISLVFLLQVTVQIAPTSKSLSPWVLVLQLLLEPLIT